MEYELMKATQEWRHPIFGGDFTLSGPVFTYIPKLPVGVNKLTLKNTNIVSVRAEDLPEGLEKLTLYNNDMLETIISLPSCLKELIYMHGCLKQIPIKLPSGLKSLWLSGTQITTLEDLVLPEGITQFSCGYSKQLRHLPKTLPPQLEYFNCGRTNLTFKDIPELPANIRSCDITDIQKESRWYDRPPIQYDYDETDDIPAIQYNNRETDDEYSIRILRFKRFIYSFPEAFETSCVFSRQRSIQRCKTIKEDLMAATWHPDRVLDWCDPKAFDYED
jgi:hypothetical protein